TSSVGSAASRARPERLLAALPRPRAMLLHVVRDELRALGLHLAELLFREATDREEAAGAEELRGRDRARVALVVRGGAVDRRSRLREARRLAAGAHLRADERLAREAIDARDELAADEVVLGAVPLHE